MKHARIVVADDHPIVARGIEQLVGTAHDVVAVVEDGEALLDAVEEARPEVVIADLSMPGINGIEATRRILARHPEVKVIILTMHDDARFALEALEAGASGYVLKQADPEEIVTAVQSTLEGEVFVSPALASAVLRAKSTPSKREKNVTVLSERQREVLELLARGLSAKQIALRLHISRKTVEYHKYRMMDTLGVDSSAGLIQYASRHGIGDV